MKPLFKHCVFLDSKEYVSLYSHKDKKGKIHSGVTIDSNYEDYYAYPYDLAWKYPFTEFKEVPDIKYIEDHKVNSTIQLREDQIPYVKKLLIRPRGIFISKPGTGKTVMCLELIHSSNLKTLVIVNTNYLLYQWVNECTELLGYKPGIIGDGKYDVKDITIATFQTLSRSKKKLEEIKSNFTLVIVDECHHIAANTFKYVLSNLEALFKLGITGTHKRKDGLEFITSWILSDNILENTTDNTMVPSIIIVKTGIKIPNGESFIESLSNLAENEKVVDIVEEMVNRSDSRNQLVLSLRLRAVELIAERYKNAIVITGEEGNRTRLNERILDSKLIISTLLNEGVNIPNLDTLHLIHPNNNIPQLEQRIARINRPVEGKKTPLVYDYWYKSNKNAIGFNVLAQQKTRKEYYISKGYKIYEIQL